MPILCHILLSENCSPMAAGKHIEDGYSGTNFNRPNWSELLERIENGEVSTLIVRDMSRLGRDYLKVGFYTEVLFVEKGVRFIAINNGTDSASQQDSGFTPFLNSRAG